MDKTTVDLRAFSDSQKTEFLEHVRTFLQQRVEEERYYRSFSLASLEKDNMELNFNLTAMWQQEMCSLKNTIERLKNLKAEEKNLLLEIEELKKTADAKATALESEVNAMRDEVKLLKIQMNGSEQERGGLNNSAHVCSEIS
jgi:predicted RNase H-like nuclease (RuvC/YqgF family)